MLTWRTFVGRCHIRARNPSPAWLSRTPVHRDNGALLNDIGRVEPVSPLNGASNPASLFFDRQITLADSALLRRNAAHPLRRH